MKRHAGSRDSGARPAQLHSLPIEKALSLSHATGRGASLFLRGIRMGQVGRAVPVPARRADRPAVTAGSRNPAVSGSEGRFRVRERFFYIRRSRGGVCAAAGRQRSGNDFMRPVRLKGTKRYSFIPSPISHADTSFRAFFAFSPQTARPSGMVEFGQSAAISAAFAQPALLHCFLLSLPQCPDTLYRIRSESPAFIAIPVRRTH